MPEQVKKILERVLEWWKKFNNKQRAVILSAVGVVVIALVILCVVMTNPAMIVLYTCSDYAEAAKVKEVFDADGTIKYEQTSDGLTFSVPAKDEAAAAMLLGTNEFPAKTYDISNVTNGSFTQTESDKNRNWEHYLENKFADHIGTLDNVEACSIDLTMPDDDGTILSREQKAKAAVMLTLAPGKQMDSDQAYALAQYISTQIGNDSTEGVTIMENGGNIIYSGADAESTIGTVSTQLSYREKLENSIKQEIKHVLVNSKVFANVEVAMNLAMDFTITNTQTTELGIPNGMDGGAITDQSEYSSVTEGGSAAVPGTDPNDDTTYVTEDNDYTHSEINESDTHWEYDKTITEIRDNGGKINYKDSSVSVVARKFINYDEVQMKAAGTLGDMTFEEFKAANSDVKQVEVDEEFIQLIANATGIDAGAITFICYEEPQFFEELEDSRSITDYAQIIIAVLIFALLGYVVFRSTRTQKVVEEIQPELSVETLLETTAKAQEQEQLEDIGYNDKSEARILIEKFVDEKPDAVALLLRNWLNEDWE